MDLYGGISHKIMFGANAVHIPFNFVRQEVERKNPKGLILGQEIGNQLSFGSKMPHVMVKGDMIFRPHLVIESEMCQGMGAGGIITSRAFCSIEEWRENGNVLIDIHR